MANNVLINGKTAVHAGSDGTLTTVDPCWTPRGKSSVLINYTNIAKSADADKTAATVFVNGNPICTKDSTFAKSTGDEPGTDLGQISGTIQEKAEFITFSSDVLIEGVAAVRQDDLMVSNNKNTAPAPLVQPGGSAPPAIALDSIEAKEASPDLDRVENEIVGTDKYLLKGLIETEDSQEEEV